MQRKNDPNQIFKHIDENSLWHFIYMILAQREYLCSHCKVSEITKLSEKCAQYRRIAV